MFETLTPPVFTLFFREDFPFWHRLGHQIMISSNRTFATASAYITSAIGLIPRSFVWALAIFSFGIVNARAQDANWLSDYNKAVDTARVEHKDILLDFTGSDWCPWCIKMDQEVLNTREFKDYADKNLVLVLVDFPQGKQPPQNVQDQNAALQSQFGAEGFPTFILVGKDGKVLGRQDGYLEGGPSAFIAKLESMKT
jgi:protein disulfide-isomerase